MTFKSPILMNFENTHEAQKLKWNILKSVPLTSLLICESTEECVFGNQRVFQKWVTGIFYENYLFTRLSNSVFIWEYLALSLKNNLPLLRSF